MQNTCFAVAVLAVVAAAMAFACFAIFAVALAFDASGHQAECKQQTSIAMTAAARDQEH